MDLKHTLVEMIKRTKKKESRKTILEKIQEALSKDDVEKALELTRKLAWVEGEKKDYEEAK